jgi:DNA-binding IclR family transcriptional regulator
VKIPATLKFWEIAQVIGVTPPYLTRLLNELEREDIIRRDKGWVIFRLQAKHGAAQETDGFAVAASSRQDCAELAGAPCRVA